jgi:pimeloyl-ACP methyl ester carboxylesterase
VLVPVNGRSGKIRRWVRVGFLVWAVASTLWLANSMRTQGVDDRVTQDTQVVSVAEGATTLEFLPVSSTGRAGLVFFCGSGVAARAYAPLLRPIADAGYPVFIVKLPYRFAPLDAHRQEAIDGARALIAKHREIRRWVIAGHSLGGALAARMAQTDHELMSALILIGTTHPKDSDLSFLELPVTKIYATGDGIAPADRVLSNRRLLPPGTKWVRIAGGNHSQFGHYGHQLFDGAASISRDAQQALVRSELLGSLAAAERE